MIRHADISSLPISSFHFSRHVIFLPPLSFAFAAAFRHIFFSYFLFLRHFARMPPLVFFLSPRFYGHADFSFDGLAFFADFHAYVIFFDAHIASRLLSRFLYCRFRLLLI